MWWWRRWRRSTYRGGSKTPKLEGASIYEQIHNLTTALSDKGVLSDPSVADALIDLAQQLGDEDYGAALLGEVCVALVGCRQFEKAEKAARFIKGQERSEHLRVIAEAAKKTGETGHAREWLGEALEAAFIYRFPAQQAQCIAAVAATLESIDTVAAAQAWQRAVQIAATAQDAGGTDGPEASGVC